MPPQDPPGSVDEMVAGLRQMIARDPSHPAPRFALAAMLVTIEDLDGAEKEIRTIEALDSDLGMKLGQVSLWLAAARERHRLFTDGVGQVTIRGCTGDFPAYIGDFGAAIKASIHSDPAVGETLERAWKQVRFKQGSIDGERFLAIRDTDDLLGPFFEALIAGDYAWIPFESIRRINFHEERIFPDEIWRQADVETDGFSGTVRVPAIYPGSGSKDDDVKLGRRFADEPLGIGRMRCFGPRFFLCFVPGSKEPSVKMMKDVKEIVFD